MNLTEAQRRVLSSAFHNGPEVWDFVPPERLEEPWRQIGQVIRGIQVRGGDVDLASFLSEAARQNAPMDVSKWIHGPIPAADAARDWQDAFAESEITQALNRGIQHLESGVNHWSVADEVIEIVEALHRPQVLTGPRWYTFDEVMGFDAENIDWVLPGLLARRERIVITGKEGFGKSTMIYQLALGAAYGVSPVNPMVTFEPKRVMILDVENSHETQVANQYRLMNSRYKRWAAEGVVPEVALLRMRDIDMANPDQRRNLLDAVDAFQPDLLTAGSGYKLADAQEWRDRAVAIQRTLDAAKARTGCAVILETHAGHGFQNDRNGYRPEGSADWLKWPEFGHGLKDSGMTSPVVLEVVAWRGDRVEGREWPKAWARDPGGLPWRPLTADEYNNLKDSQPPSEWR